VCAPSAYHRVLHNQFLVCFARNITTLKVPTRMKETNEHRSLHSSSVCFKEVLCGLNPTHRRRGAVETRLLHPPRSFNEAEHHASLLLCLKKIHKYGCCLARSAAALSYCLSLMEISSINFVSKSLVFPERRRRSLPTHRTFWCLQGFKTGNVRSNRGADL